MCSYRMISAKVPNLIAWRLCLKGHPVLLPEIVDLWAILGFKWVSLLDGFRLIRAR